MQCFLKKELTKRAVDWNPAMVPGLQGAHTHVPLALPRGLLNQ